MLHRLIVNWVYGGFLAGVLLLLLTPLLTQSWSTALVATFLHLPIYMFHQYEEHDNDRFRIFFNKTIGKDQEVLSPLVVFITNVPGVWGVIGASLYLALKVNIGFSLIAIYLVIVNAIVHIIHAFIFRGYNPGLGTAITLFIPLAAFSFWQVQLAGGSTIFYHTLGLAIAVSIHAAILVHVYCQQNLKTSAKI